MPKIYCYARISTKQQSIDRQIRNIRRIYPEAIIVKESHTGTKMDRPEWNKLLKRIQSGDTIVFDEVSRMSRNAEEGFALYEELYREGIDLFFIKEPHISTSTYRESLQHTIEKTGNEIADKYIEATNEVLMILAKKQIELAFTQAQKEVDFLHQRTREGIETARLNGKQVGRKNGAEIKTKKSIEAKEKIKQYSIDFGGILPDKEVMKVTELSRNTYYKYKSEIRKEGF